MRKISLILLVISAALFAACSSSKDDPKPADDHAQAIAGKYGSELKIIVGEEDPELVGKEITIERTDLNKAKLEIKDFQFGIIKVGDVVITDIEIAQENGKYIVKKKSQDLKLADGFIEGTATIEGTVDNGKLALKLEIGKLIIGGSPIEPAGAKVLVEINGTKDGSAPDFDLAKAIAGVYDSELVIKEGDKSLPAIVKDITVTRISDEKVSLEIKDFAVNELINVGDIKIDNISITKDDKGYALVPASQDLKFPLFGQEATAKANITIGKVLEKDMALTLVINDINIDGAPLGVDVLVDITGTKKK